MLMIFILLRLFVSASTDGAIGVWCKDGIVLRHKLNYYEDYVDPVTHFNSFMFDLCEILIDVAFLFFETF